MRIDKMEEERVEKMKNGINSPKLEKLRLERLKHETTNQFLACLEPKEFRIAIFEHHRSLFHMHKDLIRSEMGITEFTTQKPIVASEQTRYNEMMSWIQQSVSDHTITDENVCDDDGDEAQG